MMRTALGTALGLAAILLSIQNPASAQKPKSQKEIDAINAAISATDPAVRIKAVDTALQQFADTEFKSMLLTMQVGAAADMNDQTKVIIYGEQALKADPKNYQVQLWIAQAIVQGTKEFDLDKEEKLGRAEKLLAEASKNVAASTKPAQLTDEQFVNAKKMMDAQGHETLGLIATLRKKYDVAITEYQTSLGLFPEATTMVRLAGAYNTAGKPAEALKMADQVLAQPNLHPTVKQIATAEKEKATKATAGK
jgi:tetratricopeptide (TPR) repeat protein